MPVSGLNFTLHAPLFPDPEPGLLRVTVKLDPGRAAVWACLDGCGIDEGDLLGGSFPVLRIVPF